MVVCKFFLQGKCRFGENCRFEHQLNSETNGNQFGNMQNQSKIINPRTGEEMDILTLVTAVRAEVISSDKGGLWPITCFAPFKEKPLYPGLVEMSAEEVRFEYIEAQKSNALEEYNRKLQQIISENKGKLKALENPSKELITLLKDIYTNHQNPQENGTMKGLFSMNSSSMFGQQSSLGSNTSILRQQTNSIFGQQNQGSVFGQQQNIFQQNTTPKKSVFGQQQTGGSIFGQQTNSNIFNQQNTGSIFGQQNPAANNTNIFGTPNTPKSTGGIFGQQTNSTSIFGQQNTVQNASPFNQQNTNSIFKQQNSSIFGQQNNNQNTNNLFGQKNISQNTNSIFGQQNNSPNTNVFGQQNSSSIFGQQANTQSGSNIFGQPQTNTNSIFTNQSSTNIFGQQGNSQKSSSIFASQNPVISGNGIFALQNPVQGNGNIFSQQSMSQNSNNVFQTKVQSDNSQNNLNAAFSSQNSNLFNANPKNNIFQNVQQNSPFKQDQPQNTNSQNIQTSIFAKNSENLIQNHPLQVSNVKDVGSIFGLKPANTGLSVFGSGNQSKKEIHSYAYSKLEELSEEDIKWFNNDVFDINNIPEKPPTYEMCY